MSGACEIRVRGRVQGVGFRPAVWRHARALSLDGEVMNDGQGVLVRIAGGRDKAGALIEALRREPPPLAEIESVETVDCQTSLAPGFFIVESRGGGVHTQISPDARTCPACLEEISSPANRRFGYAFTNCTHCGPRLSIVRSVPYDRATTTMAAFPLCEACQSEYRDPADRRFHAEPIACPVCGPRLALRNLADVSMDQISPIESAARLLRAGAILAVKGLGGYQLACDATNAVAAARLRQGKQRDGKPFALMVRDLSVARTYCDVSTAEARLLESPQAPIVLLAARRDASLPEIIAPGLGTLGVMLPTTPLHALLLANMEVPLVMTSGNLSGEPQITDDVEAFERLGAIAGHALTHDRPIANRVDDSVVRIVSGTPRLLRRARGYAPAPLKLPPGFEAAPDILALGGEIKAVFCLVKDGQAILSQHQGDLEQAPAFADFQKNLALYGKLFDHVPTAVAVDQHPDYLSAKLGRAMGLPVTEVQHHHAHVASCLTENNWPLHAGPVLGIALDGLGRGPDGTWWGGEVLLADYRGFRRVGHFKPVAMPGGAQAIREPWRNLYAHLDASIGWENVRRGFGDLPSIAMLQHKPLATIAAMMGRGFNAPLASSCGRLFDAVAAALGLCDGAQAYEGDAAARLEALAARGGNAAPYPFATGAMLDPAPLWPALLSDLADGTAKTVIAARFHAGLAHALVETARQQAAVHDCRTVALSGGCFQNKLLLEQTVQGLEDASLHVLTHSKVPANDGGLALGQAAIAAARLMEGGAACA